MSATASPRYTVDLQHLQTVCALNYGLLRRILPQLEQEQYRFFWGVGGSQSDASCQQACFDLRVIDRSAYTDTLLLGLRAPHPLQKSVPWLPHLEMEVRLYHDAEMAEVLRFQGARRIVARNRYPNSAMLARDEKTKINEFLGECLRQCLQEGYADWPLPFNITGMIRSAV